MINWQLKSGYNIQVGSCNSFVVNWSTHQNTNDNGTLIPHYDRFTCPEGKKLEYIKTRQDKIKQKQGL